MTFFQLHTGHIHLANYRRRKNSDYWYQGLNYLKNSTNALSFFESVNWKRGDNLLCENSCVLNNFFHCEYLTLILIQISKLCILGCT